MRRLRRPRSSARRARADTLPARHSCAHVPGHIIQPQKHLESESVCVHTDLMTSQTMRAFEALTTGPRHFGLAPPTQTNTAVLVKKEKNSTVHISASSFDPLELQYNKSIVDTQLKN